MNTQTSSRTAAIIMAVTALLIMVALYHHPTVSHPASAPEVHAQIVRLAVRDNLVHGALIVLLALMTGALSAFGKAPGKGGSAALACYALGCVLLGVAMLFDGFIVPQLAGRFAAEAPETGLILLRAIGVVIQVFSKAGILAHCAAILIWSCAAWQAKRARTAAIIGLPAALLPAGLILITDQVLHPHSLMMIFSLHALWYLAAASHMARQRRDPSSVR